MVRVGGGGGQWEEPLSELRVRGLPYGEGWWGGDNGRNPSLN